jgi:hypothetical protein
MLQVPPCKPVADGDASVFVGVRPGILVRGLGIAECAGAIRAVSSLAEALASQYISGGSTAVLPVPGIAHPELAAKIDWSQLTFSNLSLDTSGAIGADGTVFGPDGVAAQRVTPTALAELQRQATDPALVAAWPGTCAAPNVASDLEFELAPGIALETGTQGCTTGPITSLESLLLSAVATLPMPAVSERGAVWPRIADRDQPRFSRR